MQALDIALERLRRRNGRLGQIAVSELVAEYLAQHDAAPRTIAKLRWLLANATGAFGERRVVDLQSDEIGAWRATLPEGHRFKATQALQQMLNRAVNWNIIDSNPAKAGSTHPEKRPFESWDEIDALAAQLGLVYGPMIVFAAATGLRPGEWIALEQRDLDRESSRRRGCASRNVDPSPRAPAPPPRPRRLSSSRALAVLSTADESAAAARGPATPHSCAGRARRRRLRRGGGGAGRRLAG